MRRIVFLCLVSAFLLTQGGEARVATWRFKPSVIKIGEEQTVLEIEILEGSASSMVVELNSSNILSLHGITRKEVELFDNGLNGDNVAGDNVYTLSQISLKDWPAKDDSNCYFFNENLAHFIVGRVMVDGKPLFIHQPKIGIIKNDYLSPSVRVVVDSALQLTQNLVNVQTKKNLYASYFRWYDNGFDKELFDKIVRLTQERVGQNYDFLVFFSPTNNL